MIEIGAPDRGTRWARDLQPPRHHGRYCFAFLDEGSGDSQRLPMRNDLQAGIAMKMGRSAFGLGAPDLRRMDFRLSVLRQIGQIACDLDSVPLQALAPSGGKLRLQPLIEPTLQLAHLGQSDRQDFSQVFTHSIGGRDIGQDVGRLLESRSARGCVTEQLPDAGIVDVGPETTERQRLAELGLQSRQRLLAEAGRDKVR